MSNLAELNKKLATRSYIEGYALSEADKSALSQLSGIPCKQSFPHVNRWASHIVALVGLAK